jgi:predicted membrane GTPase involved in stress response
MLFVVWQIGEIMADKLDGIALPTITIEELTIRMSLVNTSPFAGREVQNLMINFQNWCVVKTLLINFLYSCGNLGSDKWFLSNKASM